jgi:F5/8 type C domain
VPTRWRILDWLRFDSKGRAAPRNQSAIAPRPSELIGRSQLANYLAERTFRPPEPLPYLGGDAVACELSRQAIYWAFLAQRQPAREQPSPAISSSPAGDATDPLSSLWSEANRELLDQAAGGAAEAERLRAQLLGKSFADFAELSTDRQAKLAASLHAFAARLIEPLAAPARARERAWVGRFQVLIGLLALSLALAFVGYRVHASRERLFDLAPSASWETSSQYDICACESPEQTCSSCTGFFFHTKEEQHPSIVFDFGRERSLSTVVVENRRDCCAERAVPLVVQVSTDRKHWTTVATRKAPFSTWRESFPSARARWVKLYVARRDFLHLARVRLLP